MSSELEAMKERARAWWRKHTANPKLPYAFKSREWTDETVVLFASAEIEKAVAQAVEARTREVADYLDQIAATWADEGLRFVVKDAARDVLEHFNLQPKAECSGTVECFTCHSPIACDGRHTEKQYCSQLCEIMDCQSPHHPGCNKCEVQPKAEDGGEA